MIEDFRKNRGVRSRYTAVRSLKVETCNIFSKLQKKSYLKNLCVLLKKLIKTTVNCWKTVKAFK